MKRMKSAVALGAALVVCQASAQSAVQVYGLVDSAIAHITNADAAGRSVTKIKSATGTLPDVETHGNLCIDWPLGQRWKLGRGT